MNTVKTSINNLEINENSIEIGNVFNDRYFDFNESFKTEIVLQPNSTYKTITFSEVSSPDLLVIVSDKLINAEVNGNEITNTQMVVLNTYISSLRVANVDLTDARVKIYLWGKQ